MKSILVDLHLIADIPVFISITSSITGDIFAVSGKYKINAKSIMGIYSLDLSNPIEVVFGDGVTYEEIKRFDRFLAK